MTVTVDLTDIQSVVNSKFWPTFHDQSRYLVYRGGAGSSKSYSAAQKFLYRILIDWDAGFPHKFLCMRKTLPAAKRSLMPLFREIISDWGLMPLVANINRTEGYIVFKNNSEIIFMGNDDPEKLKSIHGITSTWLEEATEFTKEDMQQVNIRMRGMIPTYYQNVISFNPVSKLNWVYDYFYGEHAVENATLHFSTYKDNEFIDDAYKVELESYKNQDVNFYNVYTLGEWGSLKDLIFTNWTYIDEFPDHVTDIVYGVDFGYTDPNVCLKVGKKDDNIYVQEIIYRSKMTNKLFTTRMKVLTVEDRILYCDSAMPGYIEEMVQEGLNAKPANKKKHSVRHGIDYIRRHKIFVTKSSTNVVNELQNYKWRETKDGVTEEPVDLWNHAMDALRYACYTHWGQAQNYVAYFKL